MTERTCSEPGCGRKYRARGLCSTHYNKAHFPDRHKRTTICAECGSEYTTTRWDGRFCSLWCRDAEGRRRKALVGPLAWAPRPTPTRHPDRTPPAQARVWIAGTCAHCGTQFVGRLFGTADRYCSPICGIRATDQRHRTTKGNPGSAWITSADRYAIYARDGWTCWLCGEGVDRRLAYNHNWAASLDHVTPRSKGGSDDASNLRLAHRMCNALRQDKPVRVRQEG